MNRDALTFWLAIALIGLLFGWKAMLAIVAAYTLIAGAAAALFPIKER